jgi:hypothetical protein
MNKHLFIIMFAVILMAGCNRNPNPNPISTILNIRAYIDGRRQLIIIGDMFVWYHLYYDAPGRWELGENRQPTYLNQEVWFPNWPDFPDATNDSCACYSTYYKGVPYLARKNQRVWLDLVQARGGVTVVQQPNEDNDYSFILELQDDNFDGAEWYELNLNYLVEAPY